MDEQSPQISQTPGSGPVTQATPPSPKPPQRSPPYPKGKSNSLFWLATWIILFFIGLTLGMLGKNYYLAKTTVIPTPTPLPMVTLTPTPVDETANWKTYKNSAYNFSVQYPSNWYVYRESDTSTGFYVEIANNKLLYQEPPGPGYRAIILDIWKPGWRMPQGENGEDRYLTPSTDLTYLIRGEEGLGPAMYFNAVHKETMQIGEKEAIKYAGKYTGPNDKGAIFNTPWYLRAGQNIFRFDTHYNGGQQDSLPDQILSTFRFTDQTNNVTSSTPTCRPRPACLDATPRCLIPETADMCPRSNN